MTLIVDGSHTSMLDFDTAVINYAMDLGFITDADYDEIVKALRDWDEENMVAHLLAARQDLDWILEDALDYLNEIADEDKYYVIYESCLYLMADDESLTYNMV